MGLCWTKSREIPSSPDSDAPPRNSRKPFDTSSPLDRGILGLPFADITQSYEIGQQFRRGEDGATTYLCTRKATGVKYACTSIPKWEQIALKRIEGVRREIQILEHLSGLPNIVEFKEAFEDRMHLHLVMELCSAGDLSDLLEAKGRLSEKEAATVGKQIVNAVHVCHSMGVMHRDLRPENFLLVSSDDNLPRVKASGFRHSVFIEEGKVYRGIVGSGYYMAPEVSQQEYGKEIDVWSAGVILYILLSGVPPFHLARIRETRNDEYDTISQGELDFENDPLPSIFGEAKDLISKMLTVDRKKRITAAEALAHPWLTRDGPSSHKLIDIAGFLRMKQLRPMNNLKKLAWKAIEKSVSEEEIEELKRMFNNMDTGRSERITCEQLKLGLSKLGWKLTKLEIEQLMAAADVDKIGTIDLYQFVTALRHRNRLEREEELCKAFHYYDKDDNGFITRDELRYAMTQYGIEDDGILEEAIDDVDIKKDGRIEYDGFVAMMNETFDTDS